MAIDIKYNENRRTEWGDGGDIGIVEGTEQIEQSISTVIMEGFNTGPVSVDPSSLEAVRSDLVGALRNNEFTEPPYEVSVKSIDRNPFSITFSIQTLRVSVTETIGGE